MKVYIVYSCFHYDDYKRADSASEVHRVFTNEEKAYEFANNKLLLMFDEQEKHIRGWSVGRLVGWLVGWLFGWLVAWLVGWLGG